MTFDLSPLYEAFSFLRELTGEEREALASVVQLRTLRRHQYILQAGDVCRHYTFVLKGCMSLYYIDRSGKEHALMFAVEQEWIGDLGSCHHRVPSQLFLEVLEPTTIL